MGNVFALVRGAPSCSAPRTSGVKLMATVVADVWAAISPLEVAFVAFLRCALFLISNAFGRRI